LSGSCLALLLGAASARAAAPAAPVVPLATNVPDAEASYDANAFDISYAAPTSKVPEPGLGWCPIRGYVDRITLTPDAFLDAVGEPDLARHERTRHRIALTLDVGGEVLAWAGLATAFAGFASKNGRLALAGLGGMVGGFVIEPIGHSMLGPSLPTADAVRFADAYNRALRARLGLPPLAPPSKSDVARRDAGPGFAVAVVPLPGGASAAAGWRF
jgi:hypothetical protein